MASGQAINLQSIVQQSEKVLGTDLEDEILILHVGSGKYLNMDDVGADIWRMIKRPQRVEAIIDHLISEYDVDRDVCETEVLSYLNDLAADDLLTIDAA